MKRDNRLDFLRVLSMFLVIVIHIANYYGRAFGQISKISFLGSVIFNVIARVSVPIFFMISGALLLSKKDDKKKYFKRIIEKLITLVIITIIFYFWDRFYMGKNIDIINLITSPERKLLWFLYAIIGIYIALPFIKNMVDSMDDFEEKLFIILWVIFNGLFSILKLKLAYPIPIISCTYYLGYFVLGYLIYKNKYNLNIKKYNYLILGLVILSLTGIIFLTYYNSIVQEVFYNNLLTYKNIFMNIASVGTFLLIYFNMNNKENKIIRKLSDKSFGVYLLHGIILDLTMNIINYKSINAFIGIPLCFIIIGVVTYIIVSLIHFVPGAKKYF